MFSLERFTGLSASLLETFASELFSEGLKQPFSFAQLTGNRNDPCSKTSALAFNPGQTVPLVPDKPKSTHGLALGL